MPIEVSNIEETENGMIVEGYAVRFDSETVLFKIGDTEYKEVIERGALDNADLSDVPFKYNHSNDVMIMARTKSGTLTLTVDNVGLFIRANLADTSSGRDLYQLIKRGDIDKMSFAFTIERNEYEQENHISRIKEIGKLYDVAAVDFPAYDDTSISARGEYMLEIEKERALQQKEREQKIQKLNLRLRLGGI